MPFTVRPIRGSNQPIIHFGQHPVVRLIRYVQDAGCTARSRRRDQSALSCGPVAAPDVMGLFEIAARLRISKSYARQLADNKGFPDPTRLHMGIVWSSADIEAWIAKHPRPSQH